MHLGRFPYRDDTEMNQGKQPSTPGIAINNIDAVEHKLPHSPASSFHRRSNGLYEVNAVHLIVV